MTYELDFIKEEDFVKLTEYTLRKYKERLSSIDLKSFNQNSIDPIKLLFDKSIINESFDRIIEQEIIRQRDKSNNNLIGYFHQNLFKYIQNCEVPNEGWDIIYKDPDTNKTYYVELKNKHNTMNSSSSRATYIRFQNKLLQDNKESICALVEVIARKSQNIPWIITIDKIRQESIPELRRISIDKFYEIVTGDPYAFKKLCLQLPVTIEKILKQHEEFILEDDTVLEELDKLGNDKLISLYKLAFATYEGFDQL